MVPRSTVKTSPRLKWDKNKLQRPRGTGEKNQTHRLGRWGPLQIKKQTKAGPGGPAGSNQSKSSKDSQTGEQSAAKAGRGPQTPQGDEKSRWGPQNPLAERGAQHQSKQQSTAPQETFEASRETAKKPRQEPVRVEERKSAPRKEELSNGTKPVCHVEGATRLMQERKVPRSGSEGGTTQSAGRPDRGCWLVEEGPRVPHLRQAVWRERDLEWQ